MSLTTRCTAYRWRWVIMYLSVYSDGFWAGVETHLYNLLYLNLGYRFVHDHHLSIYPSSIIINHHRLWTKEYRWLGR